MNVRDVWMLFGIVALGSSLSTAQETYDLHEKLRVGQTVRCELTETLRYHVTNTTAGKPPEKVDVTTTQAWKLAITTLEEKDGSATKARVEVGAESVDKVKEAGGAEQSAATAYAGKMITLTRHPDESVTDDFKGGVGADDASLIDSAITPDADYYPDHPVSVGQTWDVSPNLKKHSGLGPNDRSAGRCRLDWVKSIGGKQYAHVSCSSALIQDEDGDVEETTECTAGLLIDLAAGMVVVAEQSGKSTIRPTDPHVATQTVGGTEFTYRMHTNTAPATTQP